VAGGQLQVVRRQLPVVGCWLFFVGCWLPVVRGGQGGAGCWGSVGGQSGAMVSMQREKNR